MGSSDIGFRLGGRGSLPRSREGAGTVTARVAAARRREFTQHYCAPTQHQHLPEVRFCTPVALVCSKRPGEPARLAGARSQRQLAAAQVGHPLETGRTTA
jgi:hypothetical protein